MKINVVTIFPDFFSAPLGLSIPARALAAGLVTYNVVDLRDYTHDRHRTVDDAPYGGGPGMVMKPGPFFEAVDALGATRPDRAHERARPALRAGRRRALRRRRRAHDSLRPLQGRRSARRRSSRHRGAVARRLRAERRRARRAGHHRRDRAAAARRDERPRERLRRFVLGARALGAELHASPRSIAGTPCPRCCSAAITRRSPSGASGKASGWPPGALSLLGVLAGAEGIGHIPFDDYHFAFRLGTTALVLILFDGGLNTSFTAARTVLFPCNHAGDV